MKKLAILVAAVMLLVATTTTATAKDMRGKFGVGYEQTLGGVSGLSLGYWVTNALGIDVIFGMGAVIPDKGDSRIGFDLAIRAIYNIARAKDVNLGVGIEADMGFANDAASIGPDAAFQFNLAIPVIVEYFFSEHFAINLAMGLTFEIIPENGKTLAANQAVNRVGTNFGKDFGLQIFNSTGLFGSAGFKFYF